jgi:hypothetical protein
MKKNTLLVLLYVSCLAVSAGALYLLRVSGDKSATSNQLLIAMDEPT